LAEIRTRPLESFFMSFPLHKRVGVFSQMGVGILPRIFEEKNEYFIILY
jgi:hypothetical protein